MVDEGGEEGAYVIISRGTEASAFSLIPNSTRFVSAMVINSSVASSDAGSAPCWAWYSQTAIVSDTLG